MAVALVATVFAVPAQAVMPAPAWTAGDYWAYDAFSGGTRMGTMRLDVLGTETVVVGGVPYPSYRVGLDQRIAVMGIWMNATGVQWYRASDYAPVAQYVNITLVTPPNPPRTINGTTAFNPPERIQWPLTPGDAWIASGWVNSSTSVNGMPPTWQYWRITVSYRVEPERPVAVPAGTFPTTPLNGTSNGNSNVTYWSPAVGNGVLLRTFDPTGVETQRMELTAFRYQAGGTTNTPPTVGLTSPIGGEDWTGGSTHPIAYVTADPDDMRLDVTIEASLDGGGTWSPVGSFPAQPTGSQTFSWTTPPVDTTRARIRVCASDRVNPPTCATSGDFTIDSTPPALVGINPGAGATGVPVGQVITITFSEPMDRPSTQAAVSVVPGVAGIVYSWPDSATLVIGHNDFEACTMYTVSVANGARDVSDPGNFLSGAGPVPNPWTFTTACGVFIVRTDPYHGETNVALTRPIVVEFSGPVDPLTADLVLSPPLLGTYLFSWNGNYTVLTVTHPPFDPCTTYTATVTANGLVPGPVPNPWSFTTACSLYIVRTDPYDGETNVELTRPIVVEFSGPVNIATLTFAVTPPVGPFSAVWSNGDTLLTLAHATPFALCTLYSVRITADNLVPGPVPNPWMFTTVCGPSVVLQEPMGGEIWTAARNHTVRFRTTDVDPALTVWINLSTDGGSTWPTTLFSGNRPTGQVNETIPFPALGTDEPDSVVRVTAEDSRGFSDSMDSGPFTLDGTAPTVTGSVPSGGATNVSLTAPLEITFSESMGLSAQNAVSIDPPVVVTSFDWNGHTMLISHENLLPNTQYILSVATTATDGSQPGNPLAAPYSVTFTTRAPAGMLAADAGGPYTGYVGDTLTLDGSGSTGAIMNYSWEIVPPGGGSPYYRHGPTPSFAFTGAGTYSITLTVWDDAYNANTDSTTATILADATPPTIAHTPPGFVYIGDTIRIDATVTDAGSGVDKVYLVYTPVGGQEQNVTMTLSGGVWSYTIPAASAAGTVHYRITAVDDAGNWAGTTEYTVEVRERTPPAQSPDLLPYLLLILAIAVALAVVLLVLLRRRKKAEPETPPAEEAPEEPPAS